MGTYKQPVGIRNNNPGCIRGKGGKGYANYPTVEEGYNHLINLLIKRYNDKTAYQILKVYAPYSDGNNSKAYANFLVVRLQKIDPSINASTKLNMRDPQILKAVCMSISQMECGKILDPTALEAALATNYSKLTPQPTLVAQPQKQAKPSFWKRLFSRKKKAVAAASPQKVISSVRAKTTANSKPYPALVKLYYEKLRSMNAINRKKTPLRWRQAQQGIISNVNIPRLKDSFENNAVHTMATIEDFISSNSHLALQQQIPTIFAIQAQLMKNDILAKDPRCQETLISMTGAAMVEIYQRQGKNLTQEEVNKLYNTAHDLVSSSCLQKDPSRFLAQCNNILTPTNISPAGNTPRLKNRLAHAETSLIAEQLAQAETVHKEMSYSESEAMWKRVVNRANKNRIS